MSEPGYYRFPTIFHDTVVFVCEDDLWTVPTTGGIARRITSGPGNASSPAFSPDGKWLAFTGRDEGHTEVYVMPALGGIAQRLTFLGAQTNVVGWTPDSQSIIFASNAAQAFTRRTYLYNVSITGGESTQLLTGPAVSISHGPDGGLVIARNVTDLARWKRYRGGLTGDLWIDPLGNNEWRRLVQLQGNVARPIWLGSRVYFVSDHEGIGNLYSCTPNGDDLRRHTHHNDYYVRHPSTDGQQIVYHAGADLFVFDPATEQTTPISIEFYSPRAQRNRKFVDASSNLRDYDIHPNGYAVTLTTRGKPFVMVNWEGAVVQLGQANGVRYRLATWLQDGERVVAVNDATGEETLEIFKADVAPQPSERLEGLDIGRPRMLVASPQKAQIALTNHRHELIVVDLDTRTSTVVDRSRFGPIQGVAWAPDGRWLAYGFADSEQTSFIKLCLLETGETWPATKPVLSDVRPAFDPDGRYLYFLSYREFNPVYDNLQFDLNFTWGMRPYLITLQADLPSPFVPLPKLPDEKPEPVAEKPPAPSTETTEMSDAEPVNSESEEKPETPEAEKLDELPRLKIDLDGITERVLAFPVDAGRYSQIRGVSGRALFSSYPVEGALGNPRSSGIASSDGRLEIYSFEDQKCDTLIEGLSNFEISLDGKTLIYRAYNRLRVLRVGEKPETQMGPPSRKNGWLDLNRIRVSVEPAAEWEQMYREAWRLQRDQFWTEDMSGIDWQAIYQRYLPLLKRVATRGEFSDLMWEMQGELGTSHAYEYGGDHPWEPTYEQGSLGADFRYDSETDSFVLTHIVRGDVWDNEEASPLQQPGINVKPGDRLVAINGRKVGGNASWREALVNQAGNDVFLTFVRQGEEEPYTVPVKTLHTDLPTRYREWVETNRRHVHETTGGRVGYVHVPDMGPHGYAEFHRGYLAEVTREGLIVDVRFNGGGHVSQLILEKLARRRLGYDVSRWGEPSPYPTEAVAGPIVALINEEAGSDGDIFSHAFKLMKLGVLIGKRTWGGVIGVSVKDSLVDGGVTTQPEYSSWFEDVEWGLENYGVEPDIEVEISPEDYVVGRDPQLERGIQEVLARLTENPPKQPNFGDRPRLALPTLPNL